MQIYRISILFYHLNIVSLTFMQTNLLDKYIHLRRKINEIVNGEQNDEMFLNINKYEYPRINKTLRQVYKQQWLDYYECLQERYADVGHEKIIYPSALIALEGTSVILKCQICISPAEIYMASLINWYFNSSSNTNITKNSIENEDHILISSYNQYIIMFKLKLEQAGQYWCEMGGTVESVYYVHIDGNSEEIDVIYSDMASYTPQAMSSEILPEYNLKIYTAWTTWSSCSTCDIVGVKLRYGYCTISLLGTSMRRFKEHEWNQTDESKAQKAISNENLKVQLTTALLLFGNKLPCKSGLIPKQIQIIPAIKNRKIKMMKGYCKKTCLKDMIFEVRDDEGNILESANNSAGIYSMIQGTPVPLPSVVRTVVYEKYNKKIQLVCPGNLNTDIAIIWQIGDKVIIPSHIEYQTNGRIRINPRMHILFQSLKFEDANVYSCWQNSELAGVIKLNVTGGIELKLSHQVFLIGAIIIISIFLIIFWKVFKGRTQYTMH